MPELTLVELLENAEYNLKNVAKLLPEVKNIPIYLVGIEQLETALNLVYKEGEE